MSQLPSPAYRLQNFALNPFAALGQRIVEMNAAGRDVIRMDAGSPDLPPPPAVIDALAKSAADPTHHGYGNYRGDPAFRQAVADYYQRRFDVTLDPATEVLPLLGSKEGISNLSLAYLDRGDAMLQSSIAYQTYSAGAQLAGAEIINLPVRPGNGYLPELDEAIPGVERAKLLWVNFPNNPTGALAPLRFYEDASAFCAKHNLLLCSDNPYFDVMFDGFKAFSVLQVPGAKDHAVEFMSLSKSHNMAGWRIGACVGNRDVLNTLLITKSSIDSAHFRAIYDAATAALTTTPDSWIEARNQKYAARRDKVITALPEIGLQADIPHGTLYVWARILHDMTDRQYVDEALSQAAVSLTPGTTYGRDGLHYVRFSLGVPDARLEEALNRLREWYRVHA